MSDKKRVLNRTVNIQWATWEKLHAYADPIKAPLGEIADQAISEWLSRNQNMDHTKCIRCGQTTKSSEIALNYGLFDSRNEIEDERMKGKSCE